MDLDGNGITSGFFRGIYLSANLPNLNLYQIFRVFWIISFSILDRKTHNPIQTHIKIILKILNLNIFIWLRNKSRHIKTQHWIDIFHMFNLIIYNLINSIRSVLRQHNTYIWVIFGISRINSQHWHIPVASGLIWRLSELRVV